MEPFEIMISESQERMAAVVEPGRLDDGAGRLRALGSGRDGDRRRSPTAACCARSHDGAEVGSMPVETLVDGAPRYEVAQERPGPARGRAATRSTQPADPSGRAARAARLDRTAAAAAGSPASTTSWSARARWCGRAATPSVVRLTPSPRAIAVSLDGNGRRTSLDPRRGGMSAVCEAARNVACTGARPAAMTNCLNFGNPETGEVGYELAEAIEGMSLACEALGLPVVSGNVSLYNEHFGRPDPPDAGGRRGRRAGRRRRWPCAPASASRATSCCWPATAAGGARRLGLPEGGAGRGRRAASPSPTWTTSGGCTPFLAAAAERGLLRSAHDVASGGLAVVRGRVGDRRDRSARRSRPTTCSARATAGS